MEPAPYRIIISPRAQADLRAIHEYINTQSPGSADAVLERIHRGIDSIATFPTGRRVIERRRDPELSARGIVAWPYIVYFRVSERRHAVEVIMVRHGMRRQPKRFR